MDVTHIYWDKCPEALRFLCKGKEGKPTVAFQAVVEHNKRIQHISKPFYGHYNYLSRHLPDGTVKQAHSC
jgi:hypothetical protein